MSTNSEKNVFFTGLDEMKKATAGGGFVSLGHDDTMLVKFLDDVDGEYPIAQYYDHYIEEREEHLSCVEAIYGNCPLCEAGHKRRYQMLANVVNCETSGVLILRKGREFVNECIVPYHKEYGTVTDRYYRLRGQTNTLGKNTYIKYTMVPVDKLPDNYPKVDYNSLRRVDWETFLIPPKLEYVEEVARELEGNK